MKHIFPKASLSDVQSLPPVILVECMAPTQERYFVERDSERANWKDTVEDIATGEIENVHEVYELGRSGSVTEDIARDVMTFVTKEHGCIPRHILDFLEDKLGCRVVADVQREIAQ